MRNCLTEFIDSALYNPAVSLAVFLRGKMSSGRELVRYMTSQLVGAVAASLVVYAITSRTLAPAPAPAASPVAALLVEFLGFTIVVAAFAGGPVSGGAFNPAVSTGLILVDALVGEGSAGQVWLYLVGPFLGGATAAAVFRFQERSGLQLHAEPSRVPEGRPS